jgi:hypothetical protein
MMRARTIPIREPTCRYARYVRDRSGWQEPAYLLAIVITYVVIPAIERGDRTMAGMIKILDSRTGGLRLSPEP